MSLYVYIDNMRMQQSASASGIAIKKKPIVNLRISIKEVLLECLSPQYWWEEEVDYVIGGRECGRLTSLAGAVGLQ